MRTIVIVAVATVLGLLSGACSTIVEGTDQSVLIMSDPPEASCKLERQGTVLAYVASTPGSVTVSKSKDMIAVTCEKDDHLPGSAVLDSEFQSMTVGNLLFGGIIGVAIDASSGAMNQYPTSVNVLLAPASFESTEQRDAFFEARRDAVDRQHADAQAAAMESALCRKGPEHAECVDVLAKLDQARDDEITRVEHQRSLAKIE